MLADISARCGAEMRKKGEFRGGNEGPLWFLLRMRIQGPILARVRAKVRRNEGV